MLHGRGHLFGVLGSSDGGVEEDSVEAHLHGDTGIGGGSDSGIDDQRDFGDLLAEDAQGGMVLNSKSGTDRGGERHDRGSAGIDQPLCRDQVVIGVRENDEAFFGQDPRGFDEAENVREQGLFIANDFELHPFGEADLAAEAGGPDGIVDGIAGGSIGQEKVLRAVDVIEHRLLGFVGQIDAADGDGDDFGAGSFVAADHFRKTAIFPRSNHETRAERAARDSELISHSFIVGPGPAGHTDVASGSSRRDAAGFDASVGVPPRSLGGRGVTLMKSAMLRTIRLLVLCAVALAVAPAQEKVDLDALYHIKREALTNSSVMDHAFWLTDVHGPRLTGSTNLRKAAEWAVERLKGYGLSNARIETWGPFGRSWHNDRFSVHLIEPSYAPIAGFPLAWTPGTEGVVTGQPLHVVLRSEADLEKWKGKLKGRIVLTETPRNLEPYSRPLYSRHSEEDLNRIAMLPEGLPPTFGPQGPGGRAGAAGGQNMQQIMAFRKKISAFWREEGAAVLVQFGYRGDGGTMAGASGGSRDPKDPLSPPTIVISPEHYNRIARLIEKEIPVKLEVEVKNRLGDASEESLNVIADFPGSGPNRDEIVMIGGHIDSWHSGTGATDNAAGSAVMLEVVRVLSKLKLPMNRTLRIALWGGEEQGLLGSRAYVRKTFGDWESMKLTPEWDKLSAYYNIDNGTGKIRGIYLQGNEMARPVFESWLAPFRDLGVSTVSARNTGGTDHLSFDLVGLPGFQFIQDPIEYSTRTHHSNVDVYDRLQADDMKQMAAIVASLVYHTANRPEKLPRKPKPEPRRSFSRPASSN